MALRRRYYARVASTLGTSKSALTATECFCLEIILLLDSPTTSAFSSYMNISLPNATYRIKSLIRKGYLRKEPSASGRRGSKLVVTEKYTKFYSMNNPDIRRSIEEMEGTLTDAQRHTLSVALDQINGILDG